MAWLASVMQMRHGRVLVAGSNGARGAAISASARSVSRTGSINAWARGVGSMPSAVRTNSASSRRSRSLPSQMLTVGWLWPSSSAERVTLRVT